jgi:hypothetical protein
MIFTLFEELLSRIEQMRNSIMMNRLHPKVNQSFQQKTDELLKNIKFEINDLLRSEERFLPLTNQNFYSQYRSICDKLIEIEYHRVQVLKKFGESELYFFNLIKTLIQHEFKITISTPMVTAIRSNKDYFWADVGYELIGIPSGEEWHLTSLPDLAHEIGHFLIAYDTSNYWITGDIRTKIADFFEKEFIEVQDNKRRPQILLTLLPQWKSYWESKWLTEFACDMLAIYFVGPAYAWTNLKISAAELPNDIYTFEKDSHPSHEARMRAMNEMLIMMGMKSDIAPISKAWENLLSLPAYKKPDNYALAFPDSLLQHLAYNIYRGCQNQGYLSYSEQLRKIERPLSAIMNEAWDILRDNPAAYHTWEKERILTLHSRFNYSDINGQNT